MAGTIVRMTTPEWIGVKDNPIQRDTERHAARAQHLLTPLPVHSITWAARLPDGSLVKLDGHTRAFMWASNIVPQPKQIEVHVMEVASLDEAAELYKTFDSQEALERTRDKVYGAMRGLRFEPKSGLVKAAAFNSALRIAYSSIFGGKKGHGATAYDFVAELLIEIAALDNLNLKSGQMKTGTMAAFLLSFRKYGEAVMPFWRGVITSDGEKRSGKMDGVQACCEVILAVQKKNYGGSATVELCGKILKCFERWRNGESLPAKGKILPISPLSSFLDGKEARHRKFKLMKGKFRQEQHA